MGIEVRVPVLPESVTEATLVNWHKRAGDAVRRDEILVDIETDKVVFEVPAPGDGVLQNIQKDNGATVGSEEVIAMIEAGAAAAAPAQSEAKSSSPTTPATADTAATDAPLSPAVRHLVQQHGLDPTAITPSGRDGRLTKADVLTHLEALDSVPKPEQSTPPGAPAPSAVTATGTEELAGTRREPMSRLRARIAERMLESQQSTAALTTFNEINMAPVFALRAKYKELFEKRHGIKLGLMSFFVKACVEALRRHPIVNASVEGNDILYHDFYDIGIAVASPRGLVVPVLRGVDQMSFANVEQGIGDYVNAAREGKLQLEDLTGGTFTITNGGVFGSMLSTPILNPPQSAILGMHKIEQRAVVENGEICARPMMYVALTYDHRIIDGKDAVQFLVAIKDILEDPARLLLEV